jgi:hypothetical protein
MKTSELVKDIEGLSKWQVNEILDEDSNKIGDSGYYGSYGLITYKGKQAVVYWDDRDAIVHVITDFHDKILYTNDWSGDYRWNHDKPIIVIDNGLYNLNEVHGDKLLLKEYINYIDSRTKYDQVNRYEYFIGWNDADYKFRIAKNGEMYADVSPTKVLDIVKKYSIDEIISKWIDKDLPCGHIRGLEYKGAKVGKISKESAREYIKTHHTFNGTFNDIEWKVVNGGVMLVFCDYCDSDYD